MALKFSNDFPDIDECANNDTHDCDHICHNTVGSYQCSCYRGHRLTNDGRTCTDKNECLLGTHNCEQLCVNSIGGFSCRCNQSYQIAPDGATCLGKPRTSIPVHGETLTYIS